jgi:hypothetical protein
VCVLDFSSLCYSRELRERERPKETESGSNCEERMMTHTTREERAPRREEKKEKKRKRKKERKKERKERRERERERERQKKERETLAFWAPSGRGGEISKKKRKKKAKKKAKTF